MTVLYLITDLFKYSPPGDGAFLVKNSWGSNWGGEGFFYISYYDGKVGTSNVTYTADSIEKYDKIYQHDLLGMTSSTGYGSDTAWGANVFTSGPENEVVKGAGFYLRSDHTRYEIYLSTNYNGNLNERKLVKSGDVTYAGYHTVEFEPEFIAPNTDFAIIVKFTTPGYNYPIPIEMVQSGYSSGARSGPGESYLSSNGSGWTDVGAYKANRLMY